MGNSRRILRRAHKEYEDVLQIYSDYTNRVHVVYRVTKHATKWTSVGRDVYYTIHDARIFALTMPQPVLKLLDKKILGRNNFIAHITEQTKIWDSDYGH